MKRFWFPVKAASPLATADGKVPPSMAIRISRALPLFLAFALASTPAAGRTDRVHLFPQLKAGQIVRYLIRYRADRQVKTQSNMVAPMAPVPAPLDTNALLVLEILEVRPAGTKAILHVRAHLQDAAAADATIPFVPASPTTNPGSVGAAAKFVEFTIFPDGHVESVKGLDELTSQQQLAWQEWLALFAAAGVFPADGVKPTQKWSAETAENVPSPLADLRWDKESTYAEDQPCGSTLPNENCAVIFTKAILKQKSSPKDATPEDFKLHQLRTVGTARGTNESITYISLETGLVIRATEDAAQLMDVTVAKTDGSNQVHYNMDAQSHAEILLLPDSPN
jgi:hypothetical protein